MRASSRPPRRPATLAKAAEYYGVNKRTIYRWVRDGRLPAWRTGPKLLFVDLDDLEDLAQPVPATPGQ